MRQGRKEGEKGREGRLAGVVTEGILLVACRALFGLYPV